MEAIGGVIGNAVCGAIICGIAARQKYRNVTTWILLGFFFGLIAIIIVSLIQEKNYPFRVLFDDSNSQAENPSTESADEKSKE